MNHESFQALVTKSGLEEARAVAHYQLMHKQQLIVAVRINALLTDAHRRAMVEVELYNKQRFKVANPIVDYSTCCKIPQIPDEEYCKYVRNQFSSNLGQEVGDLF